MRVCPLHVIVEGVIHPVLAWTAINPAHDAKVRAATVHGVNVTQKLFQRQCHKYVAYEATPNHVEAMISQTRERLTSRYRR